MLLLENIVYLIKVIVTIRSIYQARLKCAQRRSNKSHKALMHSREYSKLLFLRQSNQLMKVDKRNRCLIRFHRATIC